MHIKFRSKLLFVLLFPFFLFAQAIITESKVNSDYPKPFVVVLDAGQVGHDSGNMVNGYYEKKIAFNISLGIVKIHEKNLISKLFIQEKKTYS